MKKYVEVDREPVVGDMVKIVKCTTVPRTNGVPDYKVGDILRVLEGDDGFGNYRYTERVDDCDTERVLNRVEFVVVEEVEESTEFAKSDLKPCMVVRLRNDELYIVSESAKGLCLIDSIGGFMEIRSYNNEMCCLSDKPYDIIEVYGFKKKFYDAMEISTNDRDLLFKRTEPSPRDIKIKELQSKIDAIKREMEELK